MHRIFCATPWELEGERRAFYDAIGAFNEREAMARGVLFVPVTLPPVPDKRPFQYDIDENIRACRHYIQVLSEDWGPTERNFENDYLLALQCVTDPLLPMQSVVVLRKTSLSGKPSAQGLPGTRADFGTTEEFTEHLGHLFTAWLDDVAETTSASEGSPAAASVDRAVQRRPDNEQVTVTLRAEVPSDSPQNDEEFLRHLIVETVALELGAASWPQPMRDHLLGIQYRARRQARRAEFPAAASRIIQADGVDAGWAVFAVLPQEVRLAEIMVLPELRGKGIGSAVIAEVLKLGAAEGKPVRLDVNPLNSGAIRLYERQGFRIVEQDDVRYVMEKA